MSESETALFATIAAGAALLYYARKKRQAATRVAICHLTEAGKPCHGASVPSGVTGCVKLVSSKTPSGHTLTTIEYDVRGLTPGLHGFHIHEKSDFSNGCISAGGHYKPHGKKHGGPQDAECHWRFGQHRSRPGRHRHRCDQILLGRARRRVLRHRSQLHGPRRPGRSRPRRQQPAWASACKRQVLAGDRECGGRLACGSIQLLQ